MTIDPVRVRDALRGEPLVIDGVASVSDALARMQQTGRRSLIIDKRDEADEYGLITVSQIAREVFARNRNPERVSVYEVMKKPAVHLLAGMQARYALRLLCRLGEDHAIVTEADQMVGTVSLRALTLAEAGMAP